VSASAHRVLLPSHSSALTSHGPIGQKVSKDLPSSHWEWRLCQSRAVVKAAAGELAGVGVVVFADTKDIAPWPGQRGTDVHVAQGQRRQGWGQCDSASQGFNNGQCAQRAHVLRQVEGRDAFQIAGQQADASLSVVTVGNYLHEFVAFVL